MENKIVERVARALARIQMQKYMAAKSLMWRPDEVAKKSYIDRHWPEFITEACAVLQELELL